MSGYSARPEELVEVFKFSAIFVERLKKLVSDYQIDKDPFTKVLYKPPYIAEFMIHLNLEETSSINDMFAKIVSESERYQNFFSELNDQISGYGRPVPAFLSLAVQLVRKSSEQTDESLQATHP